MKNELEEYVLFFLHAKKNKKKMSFFVFVIVYDVQCSDHCSSAFTMLLRFIAPENASLYHPSMLEGGPQPYESY